MTVVDLGEFRSYLTGQGYSTVRFLDDGRYACVAPFLFTHAILLGRIGNRGTYEDRWCYPTLEAATEALLLWDGQGEPDGWHRHPDTGRRRHYDETGTLFEHINF